MIPSTKATLEEHVKGQPTRDCMMEVICACTRASRTNQVDSVKNSK